ncbi:MAG: hypothetical protein K9G76_05150 [Bacteroidales bacterium]|nr:hypothetical protein [Bacteroidales bacterium]MCF8403067.1 hypothetical protein [Bacteroidales bacterium]
MKTIRPIIILSIFVVLTSCIEISEKITVNENKSGKLSYTLKINESGGLIGLLTGLFDNSIEDQIIGETQKLKNQLISQPGISNVELITDSPDGLFVFSFEFENTKYLNRALYSISGTKKTIFTPGYVKIKKHKLKKVNFTPWVKMYLKKENISLPDPAILSMITYQSEIELPGPVKNIRPAAFNLSTNRNTASNAYKLQDILEEKINTGVTIKY